LNSKQREEVRKRRAKANKNRFNVYQNTILVAGVLAIFLSIGVSPRLGPFLAAGIAAAMLLLFKIFATRKRKKEESGEATSQGPLSSPKESFQTELLPPREAENLTSAPPKMQISTGSSDEFQEGFPRDAGESAASAQTAPAENDPGLPPREDSGDGVLVQIQERLALLEEKVASLENRAMELEEEAAPPPEEEPKSEPKIDLQTILAHLDEKEGKII